MDEAATCGREERLDTLIGRACKCRIELIDLLTAAEKSDAGHCRLLRRAASGHAAAAPPSKAVSWRRLTR
jgi:hypothetical protein